MTSRSPLNCGLGLGLALALLVASPARAEVSAAAQRLWNQGRSLIEQGLHDEAVEPLRKALRKAPDSLLLHRDYMDLMRARNFSVEVLAEYREHRDRKPKSPNAHYLFGRALGEPKGAKEAFETALSLDPEHPWSLQGLGGVAAVEGRLDEALVFYERALETAPNPAEIHNKIANVHLARKEHEQAKASWAEAMRLEPDDYHAYMNLGAVLSMEGSLEEAAQQLRLAVARAPGNPLAHVNLGYILFKLQDLETALAHFEAALAINPRDRTVRGSRDLVAAVSRGEIPFAVFGPYQKALEAQMSDPAQAAQHYREILLLAPDFAVAHLNLGLAELALGRADAAHTSLRRAAELAPDDRGVRYNLGYLLVGTGEIKEGQEHLRAALELDPTDTEVLSGLALAAFRLDQQEVAMSWYQKALDLEPRNPALWAQFAAAKAAQGDLHSAENASRQALSIAPRFVAARVQLVAILREARKFDQALQELDHLEAVAPGHKDLAAERSALIAARNARSQDAQDPKRVHLGRILVSDEAKAKQAEARLGQGDAFADVARALGEGPEARLGGDIGHVDPAELRPELAAAISQLQPGMTSEVLRLGDQFLILQRIP